MTMSEENKRLRFYYDAECTHEMADFVFSEPVQNGTTGRIVRYMRNVSQDLLRNIRILPRDVEASVQNPPLLESGAVGEVVFTWSPSVERETPLDTSVSIQFNRVIG